MMQLIVLEINLSESQKLKKKAMKIASATSGVDSVSVKGQNDRLVVLGVGIDTAALTRELNKKVCKTTIITVRTAPQQLPSQTYPPIGQYYDEMPQGRRCMCEIENLGLCGFCKSMNQNTYQMVPSPYHPPVIYSNHRDEPDGCIIM